MACVLWFVLLNSFDLLQVSVLGEGHSIEWLLQVPCGVYLYTLFPPKSS